MKINTNDQWKTDGYQLMKLAPTWALNVTRSISGSAKGRCQPTRLDVYGNSKPMKSTNGSRLAVRQRNRNKIKVPRTPYSLSFTTGGLFRQESAELAQLYINTSDWEKLRELVSRDNTLQVRTQSSSKRISREIISRLRLLSEAELEGLRSGSSRDQGYLLWIAICRRYKFIADFAQEVVRERFIRLQPALDKSGFDRFFESKSEWHPELEQLSDSTRRKLRQVLFRMLREAGILTDADQIQAPIWSEEILAILRPTGATSFRYFPTFESDIERFQA